MLELQNGFQCVGCLSIRASGYIQKLVDNGHRVAIVEQLTEPGKRGIVERGVVQIVTPGTIFDESADK